MAKDYHYRIEVEWTGNRGQGTVDYRSYGRSHVLKAEGKPEILCSSDPHFLGDAKKWNPEELLLASLSSCHMLWYLHLCSENKIIITDYSDAPAAIMTLEAGGKGAFKQATLNPKIKITDKDQIELAIRLHQEAHKKCFIANSINFLVNIEPTFL